LTAASKTLPFGTRVQVTNLANSRSVIVTINDRGPYVKNRKIDLSVAAADAIGMRQAGVARVSMETLFEESWGPTSGIKHTDKHVPDYAPFSAMTDSTSACKSTI
jgi:rare lipoprotein A